MTRIIEHKQWFYWASVMSNGGQSYIGAPQGSPYNPFTDPLPYTVPLDRWLAEEGLGALAEKLRELDPEYYRIVDLNNPARVVRALEVCLQTGMPYSRQRTGILIYISLLEHQVYILPDTGIRARVKDKEWKAVTGMIVAGIKRKKPADGTLEAITACRDLLLQNGFQAKTIAGGILSRTILSMI